MKGSKFMTVVGYFFLIMATYAFIVDKSVTPAVTIAIILFVGGAIMSEVEK